jgi:hypothetical protein
MKRLFVLTLLLAGCGTVVGRPCNISDSVFARNLCPEGYRCKFNQECDNTECEGTCVVECRQNTCPSGCSCTNGPRLQNGCVAADPTVCEWP